MTSLASRASIGSAGKRPAQRVLRGKQINGRPTALIIPTADAEGAMAVSCVRGKWANAARGAAGQLV